ncbi:MAG: tRNA lysidine(34) synthetase TilS [Cycloclasticus sp.]|nr:tRNA lysidine(34) synthetase TilS [Cycloclasticus sp.]MEE4290379.1 tRNA lysidine(34) synthetase TilS [Cycloclasticus sp.]
MKDLINCVEQHIASIAGIKKVVIAYSGGVDSHVLLHTCSRVQKNLKHISFLAVYIDHGLHDHSSRWSTHCEQVASNLNIPFISRQVNAKNNRGEGPEQAARRARYAALSGFIDETSVLITAQHQDDQAETFMLQLLRGAGIDGLASMPSLHPFGLGFISRPLLKFGKQQLLNYAANEGLHWVEDSSNLNEAYDRNFLRQQVIPLLQNRWPAFSKTTARSASHCAEASLILADIASSVLMANKNKELEVKLILSQKADMQRLIIREWLKTHGVQSPSEKILEQIVKMLNVGADQLPLVAWAAHEIRLFDGSLFYRQQSRQIEFQSTNWQGEKLKLPDLMGQLSIKEVFGKGIKRDLWDAAVVSVKPRQGGERVKLTGRGGHKKLKKLFNEEKILPWARNLLPLIYLDNELAAVADLWVTEEFLANEAQPGYQINWYHPKLRIK